MMEVEDFLIEATKRIAQSKLDKTQFTKSFIGVVKSKDQNGDCFVEINGVEKKCFIPLNMNRFVAVDDIVVIQDIYNNNSLNLVHGVVKGSIKGGTVSDNNIHIYNVATQEVVSSVMQVWNIKTETVVSEKLKCE